MDKLAEFNERLHTPRGMCLRRELLEEILAVFPKAPVRFLVRNFSIGRLVRKIEVKVPGLGKEDLAYYDQANLWFIFPVLRGWEPVRRGHAIQAQEFIRDGKILARLICRELSVTHHFGKINDESAQKTYGPFRA